MENETNNNLLRENVIGAAERGEIKMRPKWYFILRAALVATGLVIFSLLLLYLASFIFFILHRTGIWFVPVFGFRGMFAFIRSLPWLLILLAAVFVLILEVLVRRYSFAYRWPLLYSALAIVFLALVGGFFAAETPMHRNLVEFDRGHGGIPCCGGMYRDIDREQANSTHVGRITEIIPGGFRMQTRNEEILEVAVTPRTRLPFGADFSVDDMVVVFGDRAGAKIEAFGIREIQERMGPAEFLPGVPSMPQR